MRPADRTTSDDTIMTDSSHHRWGDRMHASAHSCVGCHTGLVRFKSCWRRWCSGGWSGRSWSRRTAAMSSDSADAGTVRDFTLPVAPLLPDRPGSGVRPSPPSKPRLCCAGTTTRSCRLSPECCHCIGTQRTGAPRSHFSRRGPSGRAANHDGRRRRRRTERTERTRVPK